MRGLMCTLIAGVLLGPGAAWCGADSIHDAARAGNLAEVQRQVKESPFLRKSLDGSGRTPANVAAAAGRIPVVEFLISSGVTVQDTSPTKRTMLHEACDGGQLAMVKLLVTKYRASVNAKDEKDWQPIHFACRRDPVEMLQFLLDQKADPNATAYLGATPLIMATSMKKHDQVRLLLQRKADVNRTDSWNRTALHVAAKNKDKVLVELFLQSGGRVGGKDKDGKSALDEAIAAGATDIIPLLEKAAGPSRKSKRTP
jgi:ankyrin repeat protein